MCEILFVPVAFGAAWCCFGGMSGAGVVVGSTIQRNHRVHVDDRPRKATAEEIERYNSIKLGN